MKKIDEVHWSLPENERAGTLLVVALHGRGSDESSMAGIAPSLPSGVSLAAPRGPLPVGQGWTWFENKGIGRPWSESIAASVSRLEEWLDDVSGDHSGVVLLGFSGGTAMSGGLLFSDPTRYRAAVLLSGTLPWDAGFDTASGKLQGMPVFWSIDPKDDMIPESLWTRSQDWLLNESGAQIRHETYPGIGHSISAEEVDDLSDFIAGLRSGGA